MKLSLKDFKRARDICIPFDATIAFSYTGEGSEVDCEGRHIIIDLEEVKSKAWFYSLLFHELAHIECYDKGIYYIFHHDTYSGKKMYRYMKKMALKAERYVDKLGKKNMKIYLPDLKHEGAYDSIEDVAWLRNWIEEEYGN